MIRISDRAFDPGAELTAFEQNAANAGAIVSFLGRVRGKAGEADVSSLYLEHYAGVTEAMIAECERDVFARWNVDDVLIIHRIGNLNPGEPIVFVCVSAAHRREAFEAADFLMDYLKTKATFWKKEVRDDGEEWIEPRDEDYKDAARWREDE
ncbi:MAG: molybdenum cofactor biosynthesis protein MoaE [Pseudomonadota bacterium]